LFQAVKNIKEKNLDGRKLFQRLTSQNVLKLSHLKRAVRFFVLNRITFSGTVEAGGYSQKACEG
jgi:DNA adenine methylase